MKKGKLYSSLLEYIGSFVYEPIAPVEGNPLATIRVLCDLEDKRYYFVDQGVPLPLSEDDEFVEVTNPETLSRLRVKLVANPLIDYVPQDIEEVRESQRVLVRDAYEAYAVQPVTTPEGEFDGGYDSSIKLDAAMRLNQAAQQESVTFFDSINEAHVLDFEAALTVVIIVAGSFQKALAHKQKLFKDINECNDIATLKTIVWNAPV